MSLRIIYRRTLVQLICLAILSMPFASVSLAGTLSHGSDGSAVKKLEVRLYQLGYLAKDKVDTKFDAATTSAVKYFQITSGIRPTGSVASETQSALFAADAPRKVVYAVLKQGSKGEAVLKLENRLAALNYLKPACADGKYAASTANAVKSFQVRMGIENERAGYATALTQTYLYSPLAVAAPGDPTATATPTPAPTAAPTPAPTTYKKLTYGMKNSAAVKSMQSRLKDLGYFTGTPAGNYASLTVTAVAAFQKSAALTVNGKIANIGMQKVLYSEAAPTPTPVPTLGPGEGTAPRPQIKSVVSVDWFGAERSKYFGRTKGIFADGTTAVITDVATGICYTVKRLGGTYHADVEPLTQFDTWQLYRIYKKTFAWTRHAVYVTIGDVTIAASINGMPHGDQSIKTNLYPGHHCVHFLNSKTHGTKKVDADHQQMVRKAAAVSVSQVQALINGQ